MRHILILLFCISSQARDVFALAITTEIKAKAEQVINHCEDLYLRVVGSRHILVTKLAQEKKKFAKYHQEKNKNYMYIIVFDTMFPQFAKATNDKIYLRTATTTKELSNALEAYSSNCIRFANGLLGFVRWTQGAGPEGFDQIYSEWVQEASKNTAGVKRLH